MTVAPSRQVRAEIKRATHIYRWLWLSPVLTVPAGLFVYINIRASVVCGVHALSCELAYTIALLAALSGSALIHLVHLPSALDKTSEFVRWHGRQALLLAAVRTAIPLASIVIFGPLEGVLLAIPVLMLVWLIGNAWAQSQAASGDCALMRWAGHGAGLPLTVYEQTPAAPHQAGAVVDELVEIIRHGRDPEGRQAALAQLRNLGAVEEL